MNKYLAVAMRGYTLPVREGSLCSNIRADSRRGPMDSSSTSYVQFNVGSGGKLRKYSVSALELAGNDYCLYSVSLHVYCFNSDH
jgi:hypothetical protein